MKEQNYGADWGDYVSFVKDMRTKAEAYDVDLLLVDTGVCDILTPNAVYSQTNDNVDRISTTALD